MIETVIVLFLIFLWVYYITRCPAIVWYENVKKEYRKIKNIFGLPVFFSNEGKVVLWERLGKDVPFYRIMIENDRDFPLTLTIKYFIDSFKINDILELSPILIYDRLKQELSVRTCSIGDGINVLTTVNNFNKDIILRNQAIELIMKKVDLTKELYDSNYTTLQLIKEEYYINNH